LGTPRRNWVRGIPRSTFAEIRTLRPFETNEQAFRLFAADELLKAGLPPRRFMEALDLDPALRRRSPLAHYPVDPAKSFGIWLADVLVSNKSISGSQLITATTVRCQRTRNVIRRTSWIDPCRSDSSESIIGLGRGFEAQRNPGVDQDDRLASLRQRLVEQTLGVPERACERILRHDSATYLIRDEDNRTG
jgi:hypothetical protein